MKGDGMRIESMKGRERAKTWRAANLLTPGAPFTFLIVRHPSKKRRLAGREVL